MNFSLFTLAPANHALAWVEEGGRASSLRPVGLLPMSARRCGVAVLSVCRLTTLCTTGGPYYPVLMAEMSRDKLLVPVGGSGLVDLVYTCPT